MNVIIMAAGVGSRLGPISEGRPKCLIRAGQETLINRIIRICKANQVDRITVVTGFRSELLSHELRGRVELIQNPFFRVTNSISSLWLARDSLVDDDVVVMNADLFFEERAFEVLLAQRRPVVMLSDSTRIATADYRFGWDGGETVLRHGKALSDAETDGEWVGMARIDRQFVPQFRARLEQLITAGQIGEWWEQVLYSMIPEGTPIYHHDIAGLFWTEVDHVLDYARLQAWCEGQLPRRRARRVKLASGG